MAPTLDNDKTDIKAERLNLQLEERLCINTVRVKVYTARCTLDRYCDKAEIRMARRNRRHD